MTVLEVLIAFFLPPVSVAMKKGLSSKVLIALLLELCGHIPGVIYGIYVVTQESAAAADHHRGGLPPAALGSSTDSRPPLRPSSHSTSMAVSGSIIRRSR
jgi:uncharacterized membrane protein YqaE (UPF0057 family)